MAMARRLLPTILALGPVLVGAGCAPDVPAQPTWVKDVRPILLANCVRCHGEEPSGGAPTAFRLDRFEDSDAARGVKTMARYLAHRAGDLGQMPPNGPALSDRQRDVLEKWYAAGAPRGDGNALPALTVVKAPATTVDQELTLTYRISDGDRDAGYGTLTAAQGTTMLEVGTLEPGQHELTWDTGQVAPGAYALTATIRDAQVDAMMALVEQKVELGTVTIAHTSGNTAPKVSVVSPFRDAIVTDAKSPVAVSLQVEDPDAGDTVQTAVEAVRGSERIMLGTVMGTMSPMVMWDTRGATASPSWHIEATATDTKGAVRKARSRAFVISHQSPTVTFDQVSEIFTRRCVPCHATDKNIIVEFDNMSIDGWVSTIYARVVHKREMPPRSAIGLFKDYQFITEEERGQIASWILGGAQHP